MNMPSSKGPRHPSVVQKRIHWIQALIVSRRLRASRVGRAAAQAQAAGAGARQDGAGGPVAAPAGN